MRHYKKLLEREYVPFTLMFLVNAAFIVIAFIADSPMDIWQGFLRIIQSRSLLVTDYIAVGGVGAALLNVAIVGMSCVEMLLRLGLKPTGASIMAVFLSMGFAFFGKNVFNMIPLTIGVWLYSVYKKEKFSQHYVGAMLVATLSPTISEIAFMGIFAPVLEISLGVAMGFVIGFIFPVISAESVKTHNGLNLYNMGFAGGLIATVLAAIYRNQGINIVPGDEWSYGNNLILGFILYGLSLVMFLYGTFFDKEASPTSATGRRVLRVHKLAHIKQVFKGFRRIHSHSGRLVTDFYQMYGNSIYINMAVLCAFGTTLTLLLGADLNGPVLAGILTMVGFGAFGKHIRNVVPIIIGTLLFGPINNLYPPEPINIIAVLFSTGLAPLAGTYGWFWGIIAGFLHINIATYIGTFNEGLNLYNNGFAASFVVMFLLPVISMFRKGEKY